MEEIQYHCYSPQEWLSSKNHSKSKTYNIPGGHKKKQHSGRCRFAASGPGRLAIIDGTMNSGLYPQILKENVRVSVCELKLNRRWVLLQDNDPKHTSKSTKEWLKKKKCNVLEWPSQSPDLNPIEMLWKDLKRSVHARKPTNIHELKQFCKEEWAQCYGPD